MNFACHNGLSARWMATSIYHYKISYQETKLSSKNMQVINNWIHFNANLVTQEMVVVGDQISFLRHRKMGFHQKQECTE